MNQAFDPLNLILLAIAVVVIFRLRSVLGTRTGHEKRIDPFSPAPGSETEKREDNVIPMPGTDAEKRMNGADDEAEPVWAEHAEDGSDLAEGLQRIGEQDPSFGPAEFLEGARIAYEMIVTAFAEADKKALKPLLTSEVYKGFAGAIDQRNADGETLEYRFVGINGAKLVDAQLVKRKANVTVEFESEMISATRDSDGDVVDGDPTKIQTITDVWTFERDTNSRDPNWKLSGTEASD